jgi:integrase
MAKRTTTTEETAPRTRRHRDWGGTCWPRADRGGVFYLKFRGPDGRTVVRNAETTDRETAERLLAKLTGQATRDEATGLRPMTAEQFIPEHMGAWTQRRGIRRETVKRAGKVEERWTDRHANMVQAQLEQFQTWAQDRKLHTLEPHDIEQFAGWLQSGEAAVGAATVGRYVAAVSGLYKTAVQRKVAKVNPCRDAELPKAQEPAAVFLTAGEIDRLISHAPPQLRPIVVLLADTGMRLGELLRLTWQHVAADDSTLTLVHTKGKTVRVMPTTARAREALAALRTRHATPIRGVDLVLPKPRSKSRVERLFSAAVAAAGINPAATPHALRHSYASGMALAGVPISVISKALGHGSVRVTERYSSHVAGNAVALAVESLERARVAATAAETAKARKRKGRKAG